MFFNPDNIYPLHFLIYATTGFWKIESSSKWKKFFYKIYHYLNYVNFLFITSVLIIDAYIVKNDLKKFSNNLCSTITSLATAIKVTILMRKRKMAEEVDDCLENNLYIRNLDRSKEDQEIFGKHSRHLTMITVMYYALGIPLIFFWIIYPLLDDGEEKRFPMPFPFPNAVHSPVFEIVYCYHAITMIIAFINVSAYDMIFYGYLVRVCVQFEILAKNAGKLKNLYPKIKFEEIIEGYHENLNQEDFMQLESFFIRENYIKDGEKNEINERNEKEWRKERTIKEMQMNVIHHQAILRYEDISTKVWFC